MQKELSKSLKSSVKVKFEEANPIEINLKNPINFFKKKTSDQSDQKIKLTKNEVKNKFENSSNSVELNEILEEYKNLEN